MNNNDDLYPRDFIINIPAPTNYIGPEKVFGISTNQDDANNEDANNEDANNEFAAIVHTIEDYKSFVPEKHAKNGDKPSYEAIPESLKTAVKCFIVTCAIRIARGQENKHNSMLIHLSRYQNWQNHIKDLVNKLFRYYKQEIEASDPDIFEEFRKILEEDKDTGDYKSYKTVTTEIQQQSKSENVDSDNLTVHPWEEIRPLLCKAVQKIEVKSINGDSGDCLTYYESEEKGISVIVIGGDKLSRGLTLEGLSVSYFLRASKMYDTLMQMGRWFGYRPGYADLCRLFTSEELIEWFTHITIASEELIGEFNDLAESGETPEKFVLKVRTHPGVMQITAMEKMRHTKDIQVSWAGRLVETYQLSMDKDIKKKNLTATDEFIYALGKKYENKENDYLWRDISPNDVCDYLSKFRVAASLKKVDLNKINEYIKHLVSENELTSWSVVLKNKRESTLLYPFSNGLRIGCFIRTCDERSTSNTYFIKQNHIVGNPTDEFIDLQEDLIDEALQETRQRRKWERKYPSPEIVRKEFRKPTNPLLLIYPIHPFDPKFANNGTNDPEPFIGFAISFPNSECDNNTITYTANRDAEFAETEDSFDKENDNAL